MLLGMKKLIEPCQNYPSLVVGFVRVWVCGVCVETLVNTTVFGRVSNSQFINCTIAVHQWAGGPSAKILNPNNAVFSEELIGYGLRVSAIPSTAAEFAVPLAIRGKSIWL